VVRDNDGYRESAPADLNEVRWPTQCDKCGAAVPQEAAKQVFELEIYVDDAGKQHSIRDAVEGMMWDAWWMGKGYEGPDGKCLCVVCPGGHQWMIDGPASNCTMKEDRGPFDSAHRCWVRHGELPKITVDKNGRTCSAGGGSIQTSNYHGFLQNGEFT
jgi:ribosomal protein S26